MLLSLLIALFVEKILKQSLQGMSISNPHSDGDRRVEETVSVCVCVCMLAEEVSMGKVRARSRKKLERQFREMATASVIEKCSNYIFFL